MTLQERKKTEALERLSQLEKLYGLNPKVRKYFAEGKLYYSYITGGVIGLIDTITYDPRYAYIAKAVQEQYGVLVYHAIEYHDTLSLLCVSDDEAEWEAERPTRMGVKAMVIDVNEGKGQRGYIKMDSLAGALYRTSDQVYKNLNTSGMVDSDVKAEFSKRLEILKQQGLMTDLDIENLYLQANEICLSRWMDLSRIVPGMAGGIGIISQLSASSRAEDFYNALLKKTSDKIYFALEGKDGRLAFLTMDEDSGRWEMERAMLREKTAYAIVVEPDKVKAYMDEVEYEMLNGGPVWVQ